MYLQASFNGLGIKICTNRHTELLSCPPHCKVVKGCLEVFRITSPIRTRLAHACAAAQLCTDARQSKEKMQLLWFYVTAHISFNLRSDSFFSSYEKNNIIKHDFVSVQSIVLLLCELWSGNLPARMKPFVTPGCCQDT